MFETFKQLRCWICNNYSLLGFISDLIIYKLYKINCFLHLINLSIKYGLKIILYTCNLWDRYNIHEWVSVIYWIKRVHYKLYCIIRKWNWYWLFAKIKFGTIQSKYGHATVSAKGISGGGLILLTKQTMPIATIVTRIWSLYILFIYIYIYIVDR